MLLGTTLALGQLRWSGTITMVTNGLTTASSTLMRHPANNPLPTTCGVHPTTMTTALSTANNTLRLKISMTNRPSKSNVNQRLSQSLATWAQSFLTEAGLSMMNKRLFILCLSLPRALEICTTDETIDMHKDLHGAFRYISNQIMFLVSALPGHKLNSKSTVMTSRRMKRFSMHIITVKPSADCQLSSERIWTRSQLTMEINHSVEEAVIF